MYAQTETRNTQVIRQWLFGHTEEKHHSLYPIMSVIYTLHTLIQSFKINHLLKYTAYYELT